MSGNKIQDIQPIHKFVNMATLYLNHNDIEDITPLSSLNRLRILELSGNRIKRIDALGQIYFLDILLLDHNEIEDVDSLRDPYSKLSYIDVSYNRLQNIDHLLRFKYLGVLFADNNQIKTIGRSYSERRILEMNVSNNGLTDISELMESPALWTLFAINNNITTLGEHVSPGLVSLFLYNNNLDDISSLSESQKLEELDLANNLITDLAPLYAVKTISWLGIENNRIRDISGIGQWKELKRLDLSGNPIDDMRPLEKLEEGVIINGEDNWWYRCTEAALIDDGTEEAQKLTEAEAARVFMNYIYGEEGDRYFETSVIKYLKFPPLAAGDPMLTYEFTLPDDERLKAVRRIGSWGEIEGYPYYVFEFYTSYYSYDNDNNKEFSHSNYSGAYAVDQITGEVISNHKYDEYGNWYINEDFLK